MQHRIFRIIVSFLLLALVSQAFAEGGRTPTYAKNGMVSSASRLASEVGVETLRNGGNAVDAAIATAFALAVTWPSAGNIGGGGFLVYHGGDGHATAFDFREKAPLAATEQMYLGVDGRVVNNSNHFGPLAVGVPGTVAGLWKAHQELGSLPWADLVAPAVALAREGIPITYTLQRSFAGNQGRFRQYPSSAAVFFKPDGSLYELGEIWVQPDLAATLELIRDNGKDGFYAGENARRLAQFMADIGGVITEEDLALYEAVEREPIRGSYRGYEIVSMPPPSSGGVVLVEMLNVLEGYDLAAMGHNSAAYLHVLTETMRRAYADRAEHLGDPDFNEGMPLDRLTSKEYAEDLRGTIDLERASNSDPDLFAQAYESEETTHFSVVDKDGNMVSLTYTLEFGYGSAIVVDGGGYLLNNEMGDFNAVPGVTDANGLIGTPPNLIRPGKRPLSSMTPTIVAQDGQPVFAVGSPGGKTIINTVLQLILNIVDHDYNIAESVEAPRIHHQWLPDVTSMEPNALSADTIRLYEAMGHSLMSRGSQGAAMGVYHDREAGLFLGASDSRRGDGAAVGY
ncbi:MAG: gamma-glutamyltransferase [Gammaproteobacteria bacterium]|nr:gamma-glutamyltransferase [Gammaproteobacteria bacterium]MXY91436.1 gamma-glutamyltransferase [Gammaproteobacteria bacterium]MYA36457.1 gamma-glutamyltransferase [Gammaproteobacteria bacterium]MYG95839.1 gamma-glutamyltransferase [Gammaproteobacteria bacterium]MYH85919.1 gamma-glutamyltransferase [Gammaproteobacteria bacterium]